MESRKRGRTYKSDYKHEWWGLYIVNVNKSHEACKLVMQLS